MVDASIAVGRENQMFTDEFEKEVCESDMFGIKQ